MELPFKGWSLWLAATQGCRNRRHGESAAALNFTSLSRALRVNKSCRAFEDHRRWRDRSCWGLKFPSNRYYGQTRFCPFYVPVRVRVQSMVILTLFISQYVSRLG